MVSGVSLLSGAQLRVNRATVLSGGRLEISAGVSTSGNTISNGGVEVLSSGGADLARTWIRTGGMLLVLSGGEAVSTTVWKGADYVFSGGEVLDTQVHGTEILSGGTASATGIWGFDGGTQIVSAGGTALATHVGENHGAGGQFIYSGGVASNTSVDGWQTIFSGGLAVSTTLNGVSATQGVETVESGGVASATTVISGGATISILAGGTVIGLTNPAGAALIDNGVAIVSSAVTFAGTLTGAGQIIEEGGGALALGGSATGFSGEVVISGGGVELVTSNGAGSGSFDFEAPSAAISLKIDGAAAPAIGGTFANTLVDFNATNESVDLASIVYSAGASVSVAGGVLTLSDGGHAYKFNLGGMVATSYGVTSDSGTGTLITVQVGGFAQAIAHCGAAPSAPTAPLASATTGGLQPLLAHGSVQG